jgi:hypothetical protein
MTKRSVWLYLAASLVGTEAALADFSKVERRGAEKFILSIVIQSSDDSSVFQTQCTHLADTLAKTSAYVFFKILPTVYVLQRY